MKWIKASERLPEPKWSLQSHNIKFKDVPHVMIHVDNKWCWLREIVQDSATRPIKEHEWQHIEWLDETPAGEQQPVTGEQTVKQYFLDKETVDQIHQVLSFNETNVELAHRQELIELLYRIYNLSLKEIQELSQPPTPEPAGELYWKQRCLAAENVIRVFPIKGHYFNTSSKSKEEAYETWQQLKNQEVEPQQNQDE